VTPAALTHFSAPVREWFERVFGVRGSSIEDLLVERGFRSGPRRLTPTA
jgi:hypothetical protein